MNMTIGGDLVPATERVVVLMSPEEKEKLDSKAARAGRISSGEFVRRAVEAYNADTAGEAAELRHLLDMLVRSHATTLDRLAASEKKLDDTLAYLAEVGLVS